RRGRVAARDEAGRAENQWHAGARLPGRPPACTPARACPDDRLPAPMAACLPGRPPACPDGRLPARTAACLPRWPPACPDDRGRLVDELVDRLHPGSATPESPVQGADIPEQGQPEAVQQDLVR